MFDNFQVLISLTIEIICAYHVKCAEKSMKTMTSYQEFILIWKKNQEMKKIQFLGRGSENVIRFWFWPLFVTKNGICDFSAFPHKTLKKNMLLAVDPSKVGWREK